MNITNLATVETRRIGAGQGKARPIGAGAPPAPAQETEAQKAQAPAGQATGQPAAGQAASGQPAGQGAGAAPAGQLPAVKPLEAEKEWTVLLYMNGNNFLSGQVATQLQQMEYVGTDKNINWVAQASRAPGLFDRFNGNWTGVRRYKIEHNGKELTPGVIIGGALSGLMPWKKIKMESPVLQDLGDKNMGKAQTLQDFLEWGVQAFPAKHYMVVMMGPSQGLSGMMEDVLHESKMKVSDVGSAFSNVAQKTGKKFDVVAIDGSTSSTMELAYELKDSVNYMIGSQGIQAGGGMFVGQIANELKNMNKENPQDALTMARFWVLMNSMGSANQALSSTISAIDLSKIDGVKQKWDDLAQKILAANIPTDKLNTLIDETQDFQGRSKNQAYMNQRDAYHFAQLVFEDKEITDQGVKDAAKAAMESVEGALVGDVAVGKFVKNAHGISVFAPMHYGFFRPDGTATANRSIRDADYSATKFAQDTAWDDVLTRGAEDSAFANALKKIGVSEGVLDKMSELKGKHEGKVKFLGSIASLAGWFNAINAWRGAPASGFLGIPAAYVPYVGLAGAAYDGVQAVQNTAYAVTELRDRDSIVASVFDAGRAVAKGVANAGYFIPQLKPIAGTAGMLMFFSPWIRDIYGVYSNYKQIRDEIELSPAPQSSSSRWATAITSYYQNKQLWDK